MIRPKPQTLQRIRERENRIRLRTEFDDAMRMLESTMQRIGQLPGMEYIDAADIRVTRH